MDDYCYKEGVFASAYEKQMKKACKLCKVKFYDKINYDNYMDLLLKIVKSHKCLMTSF